MNRKIVIAGGTGFIGKYLAEKYRNSGDEVIIISRQKNTVNWNDFEGIIQAVEGASLLINLAGKSVDCRYKEKNKAEILRSRTETTRILGEAVSRSQKPPALWINSSTATIYRHAEDRPMTESTGEIGSGFSVGVATAWEKAFFDFKLPQTRQVALRMAIVLGSTGGVMKPLTNLVRFGLGGKQGNGKQMFSWIHVEDVYRIIEFIASEESVTGAINCSSPNPVSNSEFMQILRQQMGIPIGFPSPKWLLEIGAVFIKTETELVLKSRWVIPEMLLKAGYEFAFPELNSALTQILKKKA